MFKFIGKSFKKIRIRKKPRTQDIPQNIQKYINLRNQSEDKLNKEEIEMAISDMEAKLNREKIIKQAGAELCQAQFS